MMRKHVDTPATQKFFGAEAEFPSYRFGGTNSDYRQARRRAYLAGHFCDESALPDEQNANIRHQGYRVIKDPDLPEHRPQQLALVLVKRDLVLKQQNSDRVAHLDPSLLRSTSIVLFSAVILALYYLAQISHSLLAIKSERVEPTDRVETLTDKPNASGHRTKGNADTPPLALVGVVSGDLEERGNTGLTHRIKKRLRALEGRVTKAKKRATQTVPTLPPVRRESAGENEQTKAESGRYVFDPTIPAITGAIVHRGSDGSYWTIAKPNEKGWLRVVPYGTNSIGVAVHCLDNDTDYIISKSGGWMGSN